MNADTHNALLAWFAAYGDLGDRLADAAENGDEDDPTVQENLWETMGYCLDLANNVIVLLGKQIIDNAKTAEPGTDTFVPPF